MIFSSTLYIVPNTLVAYYNFIANISDFFYFQVTQSLQESSRKMEVLVREISVFKKIY